MLLSEGLSFILRSNRVNKKIEINTVDIKGSLPGLYRHGLVDFKMVVIEGKEIRSVYITKPGISFLEIYEEMQKKWKVKW